jgi:hypothetical protein
MYYLHHSGTAFAAIVAGTIASTHAQAGVRVGGVTSVVHDVASSVSGQSWAKKVEGDDVSEDEFIRTETQSSARISFVDETDIRMGPAARMKIDRVVFKSGRAVSELVVTAEAGAVRWNSGVSQSNAYLIKTPTVIIKVRGTAFDLFAEPQKTTVVLRRGTIEVCTIDTPQRCQTLSRPGNWVIGTPNVLDRPRRAGPGPSNFADRCLSARAMAPCAILASVQPTRSGSVTPRTTPSVTPATKRVEFERAPRGPRFARPAYVPVRPPGYGDGPVRPPRYGDGPVRPPRYGDGPVRPPRYGDGPVRPPGYGGGPVRAGYPVRNFPVPVRMPPTGGRLG